MHVYVWEHIVSLYLLQNCLMDVYETSVGMKCSWSLTSVVVFRPDLSRGGSRAGQK